MTFRITEEIPVSSAAIPISLFNVIPDTIARPNVLRACFIEGRSYFSIRDMGFVVFKYPVNDLTGSETLAEQAQPGRGRD